eukprot:4899213-Pleurochrysis_carterae.AAC.1
MRACEARPSGSARARVKAGRVEARARTRARARARTRAKIRRENERRGRRERRGREQRRSQSGEPEMNPSRECDKSPPRVPSAEVIRLLAQPATLLNRIELERLLAVVGSRARDHILARTRARRGARGVARRLRRWAARAGQLVGGMQLGRSGLRRVGRLSGVGRWVGRRLSIALLGEPRAAMVVRRAMQCRKRTVRRRGVDVHSTRPYASYRGDRRALHTRTAAQPSRACSYRRALHTRTAAQPSRACSYRESSPARSPPTPCARRVSRPPAATCARESKTKPGTRARERRRAKLFSQGPNAHPGQRREEHEQERNVNKGGRHGVRGMSRKQSKLDTGDICGSSMQRLVRFEHAEACA